MPGVNGVITPMINSIGGRHESRIRYRCRSWEMSMSERIPTSFRLSDEAKALLKTMAEEMGISKSAVLELAIRLMAGGVKKLRRDTLVYDSQHTGQHEE